MCPSFSALKLDYLSRAKRLPSLVPVAIAVTNLSCALLGSSETVVPLRRF